MTLTLPRDDVAPGMPVPADSGDCKDAYRIDDAWPEHRAVRDPWWLVLVVVGLIAVTAVAVWWAAWPGGTS